MNYVWSKLPNKRRILIFNYLIKAREGTCQRETYPKNVAFTILSIIKGLNIIINSQSALDLLIQEQRFFKRSIDFYRTFLLLVSPNLGTHYLQSIHLRFILLLALLAQNYIIIRVSSLELPYYQYLEPGADSSIVYPFQKKLINTVPLEAAY